MLTIKYILTQVLCLSIIIMVNKKYVLFLVQVYCKFLKLFIFYDIFASLYFFKYMAFTEMFSALPKY